MTLNDTSTPALIARNCEELLIFLLSFFGVVVKPHVNISTSHAIETFTMRKTRTFVRPPHYSFTRFSLSSIIKLVTLWTQLSLVLVARFVSIARERVAVPAATYFPKALSLRLLGQQHPFLPHKLSRLLRWLVSWQGGCSSSSISSARRVLWSVHEFGRGGVVRCQQSTPALCVFCSGITHFVCSLCIKTALLVCVGISSLKQASQLYLFVYLFRRTCQASLTVTLLNTHRSL